MHTKRQNIIVGIGSLIFATVLIVMISYAQHFISSFDNVNDWYQINSIDVPDKVQLSSNKDKFIVFDRTIKKEVIVHYIIELQKINDTGFITYCRIKKETEKTPYARQQIKFSFSSIFGENCSPSPGFYRVKGSFVISKEMEDNQPFELEKYSNIFEIIE